MLAASERKPIDLDWARETIPHFRELEKIALAVRADTQRYRDALNYVQPEKKALDR